MFNVNIQYWSVLISSFYKWAICIIDKLLSSAYYSFNQSFAFIKNNLKKNLNLLIHIATVVMGLSHLTKTISFYRWGKWDFKSCPKSQLQSSKAMAADPWCYFPFFLPPFLLFFLPPIFTEHVLSAWNCANIFIK